MSLAEHAKERLGVPLLFPEQATFKEFAVRAGRNASDVVDAARAKGVHPGYALGRDYEGMEDALLVCVTERANAGRHRPARARSLARWRREADLREVAEPGRRASTAAALRPAEGRRPRGASTRAPAAPARARRARGRASLHRARRPDVRRRHGLLPARLLHDEVQPAPQRARRLAPGLPRPPPLQDEDGAQGALELMWRLQEILAEVAGSTPSPSSRRPARRAR